MHQKKQLGSEKKGDRVLYRKGALKILEKDKTSRNHGDGFGQLEDLICLQFPQLVLLAVTLEI